MTRICLPNRREAETIGFFPDGRPEEVFARQAKSGCDLDYLLDDACVALSLLLQYGVESSAFARSMGRTDEVAIAMANLPGTRPASIIGAPTDRLTEYAASEGRVRLNRRVADALNDTSGTILARDDEGYSGEPPRASGGISRTAS
ncbi:MAG: hypothetical protein WCK65_15365 [Rhodospirillaceae bacterium]